MEKTTGKTGRSNMNKIIAIFVTALLMALPVILQAQPVTMADQFREDGKIWVVIAVFGTLLAGFFVYLFIVDKKIDRLEKKVEDKEKT